MSNINPISTSHRLTLSLGTVDGKKVEKSVTFGNISNDITPDKAKALVTAVADLFGYPVAATKKYSTELLVD